MKFSSPHKQLLFSFALFFSLFNSSAQLTFQRTFQAAGMNGGLALSLTNDGGYVVCGQHESSGMGSCDVYVYKRDACGNTDFFNTYGDALSQGGTSVKQTADGGFIVSGLTQPASGQELTLMKLDPAGNFQWVRDFGQASDWGMCVQQTTDGGYVVAGGTVTPVPYTWDVFLLKTDAVGVIQWSKVFIAPGEEFAEYVEQTADGGFFIEGYSAGSVNADADVLAMKIDGVGNVQWANVYGGTKNDGNPRVDGLSFTGSYGKQTPDGGFAIASATRSFAMNDSSDIWLLKLNSAGGVQWNKTFGGNNNEEARGIDVTNDNGFAIVGFTMSYGFGEQDVFLLKTDSVGTFKWAKTYGGVNREKGEAVRQSSIDHGYYIDGYTSNFGANVYDAYALKTDSVGFIGCNESNPTPTVGTGTPYVMPFTYTITPYPTKTTPVWTQNSYNPNEYALCETLPPPDVAQFINNIICVGDSTVFTDQSTAGYGVVTEWLWDFGDGSPVDSVQNPVHTYSAAGTYSVSLIIHTTYSCIPDSTIQLVIVNPLPVPAFSAPSVCFNSSATTFTDLSTTATGNITTWNWNFGDGSLPSSLQNPVHTYNSVGTFTVTLILTNSWGCKDTLQQPVLIKPLPVATFSASPVCVGTPTCFNDLSTITIGSSIVGWSWNFGDPNSGPNNISNVQNPCHTFTSANLFNVTLTVTSDSGCQSTTSLNVLVNPYPVAGFTAPTVCMNNPTQFNNTSTGGTQWNWNFGDGNTSTFQQPSHTYAGYGTYIVTQIVTSSGGCVDTLLDTVIVYPIPLVNFVVDTVCVGDTTSFTDLSSMSPGNIISWNWNFGDGNSDTAQNPIHVYASPGNYNVTLTVTSNNNCKSLLTKGVLVYALPKADFSYTPGPMVTLTDMVWFNDLSISNIISWAWNLGDSTFSTQQNPSHVYTDTGTYNITLIVQDNHGCWDTIERPLEIKEFDFYIPNCFTPNGDGINEFFFGKGIGITEYEMWIFDRWGNLIYHCHINDLPQSPPCWWNGIVRGGTSDQIAQEDVYVWKCKFTSVFKKDYQYIGHVSIVK